MGVPAGGVLPLAWSASLDGRPLRPVDVPGCDELTVEDGHGFRDGRMYELSLMCVYCSAERSVRV